MSKFLVTSFFIPSWFFSLSYAAVIKSKPHVQIFNNSQCIKTSSCGLREFKLQIVDFKVTFADGGMSLGTDARISYKTRKVSDLEDYAVVQFIRGCKFSSLKGRKYLMSREYFGQMAPFQHPHWSIDSIDRDPMYNNGPNNKRHAYYRWLRKDQEVYYNKEKPSVPELFTTDLPGTASILDLEDLATNISLQFKACLYKTREIPQEASPLHIHFAEPLKCFDWASSYIYNHDKNRFESKKELDSFCLEGS